MKVEEVLECSLPKWYPKFEKVTFPTVNIPIPTDVLEYLRENGSLVLPKECNKESYDGTEDDYDDFGDFDWNEATDEGTESEQKSFPEFSQTVQRHMNHFGGEVFLKLNWSCPKDATWVAFNNNLKCSNLSQLYLLLKSSDFVAHDLTQPFIDCEDSTGGSDGDEVDYHLVLRQWMDINPGTELRVWVADDKVVCISQRDTSNFYPHMEREELNIKRDVMSFFSEHIRSRFPLSCFVMDVVRPSKDNVILVDFNPWGQTTDSLLFSWDELDSLILSTPDIVIFRYIKESGGVMPHSYRHYSLPKDVIDLTSGEDPDKLIDFLKLKVRTEAGEEDSDSDQE